MKRHPIQPYLAFCAVLFLLRTVSTSAQASSQAGSQSLLTINAPPFTVKVYVFLAEGCPICEQATPELKRLVGKFAARDVEFMGVFPNDFSDSASVQEFGRTFKLSFPLVLDTAQTLTRRLDARITPQAVITLPSGEIVYSGRIDNLFVALGKRRAAATSHDVEAALEAVLKGTMPAIRQTTAVGCVIERRWRDVPREAAAK
jgi:peroxiredoxin